MRVLPDPEPLDLAGGHGVGVGDVEERTAVGLEGPAHAGERAAAGAAGQAEQHGLGLVVAGVTEQDDVGVEALADLLEDGVAGGAGGRLGAEPGRLDPGPGADGLVDAERGELRDDGVGAGVGALLEAVVDGRADDVPALVAALEDRGRGERERVGAAAAGDDEPRARVEVGEPAAYGVTHRRDGGMQAHDRPSVSPAGPGRSRRRGRRSRCGQGRFSGAAHTALNSDMPTLSTTARTKRAPSRYCAIFASSPRSLRSIRSRVPTPLRRSSKRRRMASTVGITSGADAVHHDVGMALEQRHHRGDPVEDLLLLGRAHQVDQARALAAALDRLGDPLEAVVEHPLRLDGLGEASDLGEEVVAHPRHRGELHPVGLLVQAHPEPEVRGVDLELALDVDDVGRDQQEPAVGLVERVELAEHAARHEAEQTADLGGGDPGADRLRQRPRLAPALGHRVDDRGEEGGEPVGVGLDPGRPVDDEDRCRALAGFEAGERADVRRRPVRARRGARPPWRPPRPELTTGPAPASRDPSVTASCQSTISVVMVRSLRVPRAAREERTRGVGEDRLSEPTAEPAKP